MKKIIILFSCFFIFSISFFYFKTISEKKSLKLEKTPYFEVLPITQFSETQIPCLEIEVDGLSMNVEVDLGLMCFLSLAEEHLKKIDGKIFLNEEEYSGFRGINRSSNLFQIPQVSIGSITFNKPYAKESNEEFHIETRISDDLERSIPLSKNLNRIGWHFFEKINLLMDFENSKIGFADGFETLQNHGYFLDEFVKTPLILENGLLEILVTTSKGPLRCILDTGCTTNIQNKELPEGESLRETFLNPLHEDKIDELLIAGHNFGPIVFKPLPITPPPQIIVEAFLGMEFLHDKLVFIDFANKEVYFAVKKKKLEVDPLEIAIAS